MSCIRSQKGLTIISIIFLVLMALFVVFVIMKLVPPYIESFSVADALGSLRKEVDIRDKSKEEIYTMLRKRFEVSDVTHVTKEDVKIQKAPGEVKIDIQYEVRVPLVSNIDLLLSFKKNASFR